MNGVALVFPGQGSQFVGMGQALAREFPVARQTFEEASEATGMDLMGLCFEGPADKLELTQYNQPCVLTAAVCAFRVLVEKTGIKPSLAAGHSLGEYSALVAAGVMGLSDAVVAVRNRGKWMKEAMPNGQGGMAAIMGVSRQVIEEACREAASNRVVVPANDNAPSQIVISGHVQALDKAIAIIKERGGKARRIKVSGPFHTELMKPAAEKMAEFLDGITFSEFAFPVVANVDAAIYPGPESVPERLVKQITHPVRWRESLEQMERRGIKTYIEVGPGTVLGGLIRRTLPAAKVLPLLEPEHVTQVERELSDD